jgi:hypothetical protein
MQGFISKWQRKQYLIALQIFNLEFGACYEQGLEKFWQST